MEHVFDRLPPDPRPPKQPFTRIREAIQIIKATRAEVDRIGLKAVAKDVGKGILDLALGKEID